MTQYAQDDGFHEIQLNGKQLVFLFMLATVVSVVIFLCGVLVGRGVRAERGGTVAEAPSLGVPTEVVPAPSQQAAVSPVSAGSDPTKAAPPPTVDDELSYFNRLEKQTGHEDLKPRSEKTEKASAPPSAPPVPPKTAATTTTAATTPNTPAAQAETRTTPLQAPPAVAAPPPALVPIAPKPSAKPAAAPGAGDASGTYTVQVAAVNVRGEADTIAKRLTSKGYSAYVVPPGNGAAMFRVRVGHFKTRREAEPVFAKLQKEEQFSPWITR